jgi:CspA family cold shock protein
VANKDKRGQRDQDGAVAAGGVVRAYDSDEGWGVIDGPEVPGGCFVHFSSIVMDGYRALAAGQRVRFRFEHLDFLQDGCRYRALAAWPEP